MTSFDVEEQRTVIKMCVALKKTPKETMQMLQTATGKPAVCRALVYKWHKRFKDGRATSKADERTGRPRVIDDATVTLIEELVNVDRRVSIRDLAEQSGVNRGTVHNVLKQLGMNKVCARWVPRLLTESDRERHVECSRQFLQRYERYGDEFLSRIVTTDETMINLFDPETKQESSVWKRSTSPPPVKARVTKSAGKVMFIFFLDQKGMLLIHPVPEGQTVNSTYYSKVLRRNLVHAIRKKRPDVDIERLILHQDNAPPHCAKSTVMDIDFIGFERLCHAPYSPDLAPCDFEVFPRLKKELRGIRHDDRKDLIQHVNAVAKAFDSDWYDKIFQSWVRRHRKNVENGGIYFEKL